MLNFFKLNCAILTDCADCGKTQGRTLTQREKLRRRVSVDELRAWSLVDNSYEAHHAVERHRNNQHRNRLRFNRSGKNTPSKNSARPVWNPSPAASALRTTHFESTIYPSQNTRRTHRFHVDFIRKKKLSDRAGAIIITRPYVDPTWQYDRFYAHRTATRIKRAKCRKP